MVCTLGHSFDIARSGYVNLLQPQDRRSRQPGDTTAAVAARRRLHDRGFTAPILTTIAEMLEPSSGDSILDAGCGEGFYLGHLTSQCAGAGIDIAAAAVDAAARKYPDCLWVAANADRTIPFTDRAFTAVMSITGRMNSAEFRRVLRPDGHLLVAVAAPDDLIEVRGAGRDRIEGTLAAFPEFRLVRQQRATTTAELSADDVEDVRLAIYRPRQETPAAATRMTFSLDLLLFRVSAP